MVHAIQTAEDLRWFLSHTDGFRGGYVTDVHVAKRRLFDEDSGREVAAGSTATVTVRYAPQGLERTAKLTMVGLSDLSLFEQAGGDASALDAVQVEWCDGMLRFWFDPHGRLFVVCEEARLEEVAFPQQDADGGGSPTQWLFQADEPDAPSVEWLLDRLDRCGLPCVWRASSAQRYGIRWEGTLTPMAEGLPDVSAAVELAASGPIDQGGFAIRVRPAHRGLCAARRLMSQVAQIITQSYAGTCLEAEATGV